MPLHLDYRPATLNDFIGNEALKESLDSVLARTDRPHSYLFTGPSGCGKTTLGRILKNILKCSDEDFKEYDAANSRGIDTVRDIAENCHYSPMNGLIKMYLLDECHQFTGAAANALLKLLEDTPKHVYIILCTTEPEKLLRTIITRCSSYQVKPLIDKQMKELLNSVLKSEKVTDFSEKVKNEIVKVSEGSARQALVLLDQVIDLLEEATALEAVNSFASANVTLGELFTGVYTGEKWDTLRKKVAAILETIEPESIRYYILSALGNKLLLGNDIVASELIDVFSENTFYTKKAGIINAFFIGRGIRGGAK